MENLKDILNNYNNEEKLELFSAPFIVSAERNIYTHLRIKYAEIADSLYMRYLIVDNSYQKIDDLIGKGGQMFNSLLNEAVQEVVNDALSIGIVSLDVNTVLKECQSGGYLDSYINAYNKFYTPYKKAIQGLEQVKANRYYADLHYGDSSDFVESAMHNALDKGIAKSELKTLFNNSSLRNNLKNGVWCSFFKLHLYIINKFEKKAQISGFTTDIDISNANGMFNNITNPSLSNDQKKRLAVKILEFNPYSQEYYIRLNEIFPDNTYELIKLADFFGIKSFINIVVNNLIEFTNANIGTTEDDADNCRYMLNQKIAEYGISSESAAPAFRIIDDRCEVLDMEYRTVEGIIFESRDEADSARSDLAANKDMLLKPCSEFIYRADYVSHIDALQSLSIPQQLKEVYAARYQIELNEFDKMSKLAELYEQKASNEKMSFKSRIASVGVSSAKQKDAWEKLTHNGEYKLSEVIAGRPEAVETSSIFDTATNLGNSAKDIAKSAVGKFGSFFKK